MSCAHCTKRVFTVYSSVTLSDRFRLDALEQHLAPLEEPFRLAYPGEVVALGPVTAQGRPEAFVDGVQALAQLVAMAQELVGHPTQLRHPLERSVGAEVLVARAPLTCAPSAEGEYEIVGTLAFDGAPDDVEIGYWIDEAKAGNRYIAEAVVAVIRFAFEHLHLHRIEICIVPRNHNSRRVVEVLGLREEGVALRFLEIHGAWEDHVRYAITAEEWDERAANFAAQWC